MKIESLKGKTILLVIMITLLCAAGSAFIAFQVVEKQMMKKYDADKKTSIETLSYSLSPMLELYDYKQVEQLIKTSISYAEIVSIGVFDHDGTLIKSATEQRVPTETLDVEKRKITTSLGGIIGSLEVGFSKEYIHNRIRTMVLSLIFGMIGIFFLIALGLYLFMKQSIVEPLETFAKTIHEMTYENLSARVKIYRNDEIGTLAASFNQMAGNLEKSHEALRESEDRFHTIFNAVNDAVFVHDMQTGTILDVNNKMCEMFGYSREEARRLNIEDLGLGGQLHPRQDTHGRMEKAGAGEPQIIEVRARQKSGDIFWAEVSMRRARIIREDCLLVVVRNISERKQTEEELRKYREHLEELVKERTTALEKSISLMNATFESTADGILAVDTDRKISACNNKFVELWNIPDEIIESKDGKRLLEYIADQIDDPREFIIRVEDLYSRPEREGFDVLKGKDGRILERYSSPQRLGDGVIGRVWSFRDVTQQKRAERALQESEKRLTLALKGGDLGFWDANLQTGETIFNERYATMLGYELHELDKSRETWLRALHPDDRERILKIGEDYRAGRIPDYEVEYRAVTKNGATIWQVSKGALVASDENGTPLRMIGTVQDITARKNVEKTLERSKREWEATFDAISDWVSLISMDHKILRTNGACKDLLKRFPEEILNQYCFKAVHGSNKPCPECPFPKMVKSRKRESSEFRLSDGRWLMVSVDPVIDKSSNLTGYVHILRDVTERKQAEDELRNRTEELEMFNEAMVDREMRIIEIKKEVNHLCNELGREEIYSTWQEE